jgi:exodeoxyribonuclease VII small subunit
MCSEMEPDLRFEAAISQLVQLVEDLERGEPELTSALKKYETAVALLTRCHEILERAERKVGLLTGVDEHGKPLSTDFDAVPTLDRGLESPVIRPNGNEADPQSTAKSPRAKRRGIRAAERGGEVPEADPTDPPF